jgi:hypothetical protein
MAAYPEMTKYLILNYAPQGHRRKANEYSYRYNRRDQGNLIFKSILDEVFEAGEIRLSSIASNWPFGDSRRAFELFGNFAFWLAARISCWSLSRASCHVI